MKKLIIIFAVILGITITAGLLLRQDKPIDKPAGAITLWYLDGTTLRPSDPTWSASVTAIGDGTNSNIPFLTIGNTASLSFERALTGTANQITVTDNGANSTAVLSIPSLFSITAASISTNFEVSGVASISSFVLPLTTGGTLGDCDAAGDTLNWDATTGRFVCGTDATGSIASNSLDFDEFVDAMTLDANLTIASTSSNYTWNFGFTNLVNIGSASYSRGLKVGSNLFRISPTGVVSNGEWQGTAIADAFVNDAITISGGTLGSNNISGTLTTTGTLTIGDGGDSIIINSSNWDVDTNGAFTGVTGLTMTGNLVASTTTASHSFGGTIEGPSDNTLGIGTALKAIKSLFAYAGKFITSLIIPNASGGPTIDVVGKIGIDTASSSLNFHDGTAERVLRSKSCFTYAFEAPTTTENWGNKRFRDPFTVSDVSVIASGSNAVGWNLTHGAFGAITTNLFSANKSASASSAPIYTSFADATLADNEFMQLKISSGSATIENLDVTVCGSYDP